MFSIMDRSRLTGPVLVLIASLAMFGCSSSAGGPHLGLRTPAQASRFITSVAKHGNPDRWALVAGASTIAARVWAERAAVADIGSRVRREGSEWGCGLLVGSVNSSSFGVFSRGDHEALANVAETSGATPAQVQAVFSDVSKLSLPDLRKVTAALCPNEYFE